MTLQIPRDVANDFDKRKLEERLTPTLDALKQQVSSALSLTEERPRPEVQRGQPIQQPPAPEPTPAPQTEPMEERPIQPITLPSARDMLGLGGDNGSGQGSTREAPIDAATVDVGDIGGGQYGNDRGTVPVQSSPPPRDIQGDYEQPLTQAFQLPSARSMLGMPEEPAPSPLTTLGGTPEAEALTQPGGTAFALPQTPTAAPQSPTAAPETAQATNAGPQDIEGYIRQAAARRGIDPNVAVGVAMSEGGVSDPVRQSDYVNPKTGRREESFGPFQLFMGGGLGNAFQQATGKSPSDPSAWRMGVDFALDQAAKGGWGPWHGAARVGIGNRQGLDAAKPVGIEAGVVDSVPGGTVPSGGAASDGATRIPDPGQSTSLDFQKVAEEWKGLPYVFGGAGGRGKGVTATDCSGFVAQLTGLPAQTDSAYRALQQRGAVKVDETQAKPGDIVFYMGAGTGGAITHHMGIFAGPGKVLDMSTAAGAGPQGGVAVRPIGHGGVFEILRDPTDDATPPPPPQAQPPTPIVASSAAEESGGTKPSQAQVDTWSLRFDGQPVTSGSLDTIKGVPVAQAMDANRGSIMAMEDLNGPAGGTTAPGVLGDGGGFGTAGNGYDSANASRSADSAQDAPSVAGPPPRDTRGDYAPRATEPGDFSLPVTAVPPVAGPGGAVEPTRPDVHTPTSAAPASLGDQIKGAFTSFGETIGNLLGGQKPDLSVGATDIQNRATAEPQGPLPLDPLGTAVNRTVQQAQETPPLVRGAGEVGARLAGGQYDETPTSGVSDALTRARNVGFNTLLGNAPADLINNVADEYGVNKKVNTPLGEMGVGDVVGGVLPGGGMLTTERYGQNAAERAIGRGIGAVRSRLPSTAPAAGIVDNAVVIFPESLDKITNATAGTPGGLVPGRSTVAMGAGRGAAQGAVAGGYEASQQEGATPQVVAGAALTGGAEGAVLGGARRAFGPRGTRTLARAVNQPPKTPAESWDAVTDTIRADAPDPFPERVANWARKLPDDAVRNMFDATVPLRQATEAAQKALGRKLQPDENAWLLARLLPGVSRRADLIARDALGPAARGLDDVGYERLNGYLAALDAVDKSKALGNPNRKFGSFTGAEAQQALDHLRSTLSGPEMSDLDSRAALVRDHVNGMRDRMAESGLISQDMADEFKQKYPNYSPIQFTDWMDQAERAGGSTASLSVPQNGVKRLTEHGASYGRQAPMEALLEATHDVERRAAKNEAAQAFVGYAKVDPIAQQLTRPANDAAVTFLGQPLASKRRPNETTFTMWDNGTKHEFYIDKDLEGAFRQDQFQIPGIAGAAIRAASSVFRAGATGSNLLFLIPNAIGDAVTATIRGESPASLARGYQQAFTRGPEYEAAMKAGVGYSGFIGSGGAASTMRELRGSLNTLDQLKEYASWANPLKVAQDIGERVEMAPRVGMFGQMTRQGASPQEAALAGRDVTLDFARAGLWSRAMNQIVPFFNVGMQAPAQVARFLSSAAPGELKPSQAEALARVSGMVVAPTVALEVYNRTHDSYADVPQYDKDRGLVIMDPRGPGPENPDTGRPTPRYAMLGLREWTPFAIATRAAMDGKLKPEDWKDLAARMSQYSSPVSLSEGVQSVLPPWLSVPIEMKANYDAFRQRPIVPDSMTDRLPEEQFTSTTSETSKLIGRALQKPPAMIEHAIRGIGTGVAGQALAASDTALRAVGAVPAREDTGLVKDLPGVGGLAGRFYREQGGQLNADARQQNDAQFASIMRDAGLRGDEVSRPGWTIGQTRLNAAEKAQYDRLFNDYLENEIGFALVGANDPAAAARKAAERARQQASKEVLATISPTDRARRELNAKAS